MSPPVLTRSLARGAALVALLLAGASAAQAAPVVGGDEQLARGGPVDPLLRGAVLLGELNCLSCHKADAAVSRWVSTKEAPRLDAVGSRVTPQYLRRFLSDPQATKPGTTMPDPFSGWSAADEGAAVERLVHFLASRGGPMSAAAAVVPRGAIAHGRALYHEVGCAACHGPEKGAAPGARHVPLGDLAGKTTLPALAAFLQDPAKARPAGRMPSLRLSGEDAQAIAAFLLRGQIAGGEAGAPPVPLTGVKYEYYEREATADPPPWESLKPHQTGQAPSFEVPAVGREAASRMQSFSIRFSATLQVPRAGEYTFYSRSNDGSEVFVDGKRVVENHGFHDTLEKSGKVTLAAGAHAVVVGLWNVGSNYALAVSWEGPGIKKERIPGAALSYAGGVELRPAAAARFAVDARLAGEGERLFASLGCASCHRGPAVKSTLAARPLRALDLDAPGCVGAPRRGAPAYGLRGDQAQAIKATLRAPALAAPPVDRARGLLGLARMGCLACHKRDGLGGISPDVDPHAITTLEVDLGDEGRLPPALVDVGAKLKPGVFERVALKAELHVRPYMAIRMPTFSADAEIKDAAEALRRADARPDDVTAPPFDPEAVKAGRRLVGTSPEPSHTGLGCVNCHLVAGQKASIPGVDLATVYERLTPGWFDRWLANPPALRDGTRMPAFWGEEPILPEVAGGDPKRQRAAIWSYLSLGAKMPLPSGLNIENSRKELIPAERPIVYRTFVSGAGPRAIVVGHPEKVHVAFDANVVRLAKAWRGRFWDPSGTWTGRSGRFNAPLGTDVIDLPPGPALALLEQPDAPWPAAADKATRNLGGRFAGYRLNGAGQPRFEYRLGAVQIAELPRPIVSAAGQGLVREFTVKAPRPPKNLFLLAGAGTKIAPAGPGAYKIDDKVTVLLRPEAGAQIRTRPGGAGQELLVPITAKDAKLEVELQW